MSVELTGCDGAIGRREEPQSDPTCPAKYRRAAATLKRGRRRSLEEAQAPKQQHHGQALVFHPSLNALFYHVAYIRYAMHAESLSDCLY